MRLTLDPFVCMNDYLIKKEKRKKISLEGRMGKKTAADEGRIKGRKRERIARPRRKKAFPKHTGSQECWKPNSYRISFLKKSSRLT